MAASKTIISPADKLLSQRKGLNQEKSNKIRFPFQWTTFQYITGI